MPLYKMQVSIGADTAFPKDRIVNTFHLNDQGALSNPDGLCADTIQLFQQWYGEERYMSCTAYEVAGPPPHYPVGFDEINSGAFPASIRPREVAICLSYYAERNLPRQRGRIFLCAALNSQMTLSLRPTQDTRDQVLALAQGIADLGGVDVDWQVWSPTSALAKNVTNVWCDDEWDTIRSRGLSPTTRSELVVDE